MKTILVDAVNTFVLINKGIFTEMHQLLESYENRKLILTGADDAQIKSFGLDHMPYEVFTLKHDPEKTDPVYYVKMLAHFQLKAEEVLYFEHHEPAVKSAASLGITAYHYDKDLKDLIALKSFIDAHL